MPCHPSHRGRANGAVLLLGAILIAGCTTRQAIIGSPAPLGAEITPASVQALLEPLAHDSMMGRATWTAGTARAARMLAAQMARIGLEPAGDSGYYQRIPGAMRTVPRRRIVGTDTTMVPTPTVVRLASFADWDSIPADRRRLEVNVVGRLRGSGGAAADSIVVVGAHYDHVGMRAGAGPDSIYNGADDDGSGTVAVLEIARAIAAAPRPRRTIVFAAFTGEEVGGVGSRWYLANPTVPLSRIVAQLQIEMIGRPDSLAGGTGRAWLTGYERSTMGEMLAAQGIPIVPDPRPTQQFFVRSDNIAFARAGIPAHTLSSFNLHTDYHQPSDEASRTDYEHMAAVIRAATRATVMIADGPAPTWKPGGRP